jgi:hypothetical protein
MKVKATIENVLFDSNGDLVVSFRARSGESIKWSARLKELQKRKDGSLQTVRIDISKWKENRSLDANAYFHLLVDKIAKAVGIGADECKVKMVLEYGAIATDSNGEHFSVFLPKSVDVFSIYPYAKEINETDTHFEYILYKQTRTLDSKEMYTLIQGVIYEAEELGIETATPEEKAKMLARWQGEKQKK